LLCEPCVLMCWTVHLLSMHVEFVVYLVTHEMAVELAGCVQCIVWSCTYWNMAGLMGHIVIESELIAG